MRNGLCAVFPDVGAYVVRNDRELVGAASRSALARNALT
jgi:hypothetical protein